MANRLTVDKALEAILDDDLAYPMVNRAMKKVKMSMATLENPHFTVLMLIKELGEAVVDSPFSDHDGNNGDLSDSGDGSEREMSPERGQSNADGLESSQSLAEESVTEDNLDLPEDSDSIDSGKLDTSC